MIYYICITTNNTTIAERRSTMFDIDMMSRIPIYEQLCRKVTELILKGVLKEHDKLPSVRSLAAELGVNPNTVAKAYALLERDGIIYSLPARGSFIATPNLEITHAIMLKDFDESVRHALSTGISKDVLTKRIETLEQEIEKEDTST